MFQVLTYLRYRLNLKPIQIQVEKKNYSALKLSCPNVHLFVLKGQLPLGVILPFISSRAVTLQTQIYTGVSVKLFWPFCISLQ